MGSIGKSPKWVDKYGSYAATAAIVLDVAAAKYLGFPVVIPAAVYSGLCYILYKTAGIVSEELKCMKKENDQRRALRRLSHNSKMLEKRLEYQ